MSSAPSVNDVLTGYLAGRVSAEQVVAVVAATYWEQGAGSREQYQPMMEIIERAHPGIIELRGTTERPGFAVRLQERPFPKQYEGALREAVHRVARTESNVSPLPSPGLFARLYSAVRKLLRI